MRTVNLIVDGMACRRCVREVTGLLRDVPGVETVSADARRSRVSVTGTMTLSDVLEALATTQFVARALPEPAADPDFPS